MNCHGGYIFYDFLKPYFFCKIGLRLFIGDAVAHDHLKIRSPIDWDGPRSIFVNFPPFWRLFWRKSRHFRRKINMFIKKLSGISRNRSGTVSRVPGRSTCTYHTRDELRSPYDGRVMIIWLIFSGNQPDRDPARAVMDCAYCFFRRRLFEKKSL